MSGDSTVTSFISNDLEDLEESDEDEEEEGEVDEDETQWDPDHGPGQNQGQASIVSKLPRKSGDLLIEWLMAYRKRFGSVKYRVLPETTIIAMSRSVPLTADELSPLEGMTEKTMREVGSS